MRTQKKILTRQILFHYALFSKGLLHYVYVVFFSTHSSAFKAVGKNNGTKVKDTVSGQGHSQIPSASSAPTLSGALPIPPRPKTSPGRASSADRENVPPPLVPRSAKLTSPQHNLSSASSSRHSPTTTASGTKQGSPLLGAAKATSSTLSKPTSPRDRRGNKHDISSHSGGERSHHSGDRGSGAHGATSGNSVSPVWKHSMSVCANITPPNVALGTKGITAPGLSTAEMGAVSHMHGMKDKDKVRITVNTKIFARVLFSRNFANAKFHEIKPL